MTNQDLLEAAQYGDLETLKAGLEQKLDPNYAEADGYTLVHWAAQEGYTDIIELLVQFGADVDATSQDMTALYNAAGEGNLEVVKTLVDCGARVNNTQRIGAALHNAAAYGHKDVVEFLITSGANVNVMDDEGHSPLLMAMYYGHDEVVTLLVAQGAQKYITDAADLSESLKVSHAVLRRYDERGYEHLNDAERVLVCILTLKFEVENQGLDHYYANSSGDLAGEVVPALERIGASHTAALMRQANALFENGRPPQEREARVEQITANESMRERLTDDLTDAFYEDQDSLRELLDRFIAQQRDQLPIS